MSKLEGWAERTDGVLYTAIREGRVRVTEGQLRINGSQAQELVRRTKMACQALGISRVMAG